MRCTGNDRAGAPPATGTAGAAGGVRTKLMRRLHGRSDATRTMMPRRGRRGLRDTLPPPCSTRAIKHCRACGAPAHYGVPADDNRDAPPARCRGTIHYENPLNVVGTVPVWRDQVLLCRRNIEPRYGCGRCRPASELGETRATAPCAKPSRKPAPRSRCRSSSRCSTWCASARCISSTARAARHALRPRPETIGGQALPRRRDPLGADRLPHREGNPEALVSTTAARVNSASTRSISADRQARP